MYGLARVLRLKNKSGTVVKATITVSLILFYFFFNDTATTEIYTLSLHDALPISHPDLRPVLEGPPLRHGHAPQRHRPTGLRRTRPPHPLQEGRLPLLPGDDVRRPRQGHRPHLPRTRRRRNPGPQRLPRNLRRTRRRRRLRRRRKRPTHRRRAQRRRRRRSPSGGRRDLWR